MLRRRRALAVCALGTLVALTVWVAICLDHVASPRIDDRAPVDAVYVIGPVETRIKEAFSIMDEGVAPLLLATTSVDQRTGEAYATDHCGLATGLYRVECVLPDPYTTRGEARLLAQQVEQHGWSRVAVITSTPHAARTRLLMERCVGADVLVWTADDQDREWTDWLGQFVYQSGAWVKTQVVTNC